MTDDVRARAIEAAESVWRRNGLRRLSTAELLAAVVDAIEPIIRVAMLDHWIESPHMDRALEVREAEVRERLRAQVEALRDSAANARDVAQADGALVLSIGAMFNVAAYDRVLALLDESDE
jgi:hypothetical protein